MPETSDKKTITRIAPSPTGNLHIGTARTALFNYLFARQHGGVFIVRSEDTDKERSKKEFEIDINAGLDWLGLSPDAFYRQSERTDIYKEYITKMIESGKAFVSEEEKEGKSSSVIRFKNPNKEIKFDDLIRGEIIFDTTDLGDFVIAKDMESPLYHLTVVVDDFLMDITHVIRGEDHISNTPRQILLQEAIGAPRPMYAHLPLIFAPDKTKLSKRRHGAEVSVAEYRKKGYLSEAILNFVALMGWSPQSKVGEGEGTDVLTLDELIKKFSIEKVQKGGAVFNIDKLKSLNKEHMARLAPDVLEKSVLEYLPPELKTAAEGDMSLYKRAVPLMLERVHVYSEISDLAAQGDFWYFFRDPQYEISKLLWKDEKDPRQAASHLEKVLSVLTDIPEEKFDRDTLKSAIWDYATGVGRGAVLWPMRYALSGREKSPDPFTLAEVLKKEVTVSRLTRAIGILQDAS